MYINKWFYRVDLMWAHKRSGWESCQRNVGCIRYISPTLYWLFHSYNLFLPLGLFCIIKHTKFEVVISEDLSHNENYLSQLLLGVIVVYLLIICNHRKGSGSGHISTRFVDHILRATKINCINRHPFKWGGGV